MIKAVLLDMDGTILDTERLAYIAWEHVLLEDGYEIPPTLLYDHIGLNERSSKVLHDAAFGDGYDFWAMQEKCNQYYREIMNKDGVAVKKGFHELAEYLVNNNIKRVVATSTNHDSAVRKLKRADIWQYIDALIGGDEIANGKPDPEIFLKAAALAGVPLDECLVVEDSENGIKSAHNAGIKCVYIKDMKEARQEIQALSFRRAEDLSGVIGVIEELSAD